MKGRSKISIIGAGNVGATLAHWLLIRNIADIVLLDIEEDLAKGKALDLMQAAPIYGLSGRIIGTKSYTDTENSDIVIITAGLARKPGMSRDELLEANCKIVTNCAKEAAKHSPNAILIIVTNPLDAMVYAAYKITGFNPYKVIGQAGVLDLARYKAFIAEELKILPQQISGMLIGGHGDDMVPLPRFTNVSGIPITEFLPCDKLERIIERTRKGGAEIVSLLKTSSAFYAPSAATARMAEAIIRDENAIMPCSCYCKDEYNVGGYFVGTPCILGNGGVKKVIELPLDEKEMNEFQQSIERVRQLCMKVDKMLSN